MNHNPVKSAIRQFGLPRIIIVGFFIFLVIAAGGFQMNLMQLLSDCVRRWGMFGILTLAMVPAVQCGIGLNFGISMGIVGGLLGGLIVIELDVARIPALVAVGPMFWMLLPFQNGELKWPNAGKGLRNTISLSTSFSGVMNDTLSFKIGNFTVPTGLLLFMFFMCLLVWLFMKSKTGMAMSAAGSNPMFAKAAGINVNRMRLVGTTLSTVLAAVGIIVYAQGFGFMQLYNGPMMMGFNSVAAVLIGGASPRRARISNVLLGTFLFQGILALGLPVANQFIPEGNLSEVMRLIISNGIIIYALAQTKEGDGRE